MCVLDFLLTQPSYNPTDDSSTIILSRINTGSTASLSQYFPLPKVAFRGSEQRLRIQKTPTRIASILLIVVHLATPAGIHTLDNLIVSNAGLTFGNSGNLRHDRLPKTMG